MKKIFVLALCFLVIGFAPSCKEEEEDCIDLAVDLQDELTAMEDAALVYASDSSATNCAAYKSATQDYIDGARDLVNCSGLSEAQKATYEQSLQEAEDDLAGLPC